MKAHATLKNVDSESCKPIIVRNLNRILDIRIIDIDVEYGILHFLYNGQKTLEQVKKELVRIGYPIQKCSKEVASSSASKTDVEHKTFGFIGRARRPYFSTGR